MALPIVMPSFGMYTADGTLVSWLHPSGARVREGEPVLEIETDKATQEVVAPATGLLHQVLEIGSRLHEQMVIGYVLAEGEKPPVVENKPAVPALSTKSAANIGAASSSDFIKATPIARRLAQERGIALTSISPSGPGGRIVEADVLAAADRPSRSKGAAHPIIPINWRVRKRVPFSGVRRAIAERLKQSQNTAISLTLTREVPAKHLVDARTRFKEATNDSIPVDALFVKLLALALREQPEFNVVVSGDELVFLDEVNIGFAVAISNGLSVPVIHGADALSLPQIGTRMGDLVARARDGRLKGADIEGGTSTISNLGGFGIDSFTPVLNPPQSTILGIGRIISRPVVHGSDIAVLPTVWLSLTFDHRVGDGAAAAQLLDAIARQMNDQQALDGLIA